MNGSINRLWLRLVLLAGGAGMIIGSAGLLALRFHEARALEAELGVRMERQLEAAALAVTDPLAAQDPQALQRLLTVAVAEPSVVVASVFDVAGRLLARVGDSDHEDEPRVQSLAVTLSGAGDEPLGRLEIRFRPPPDADTVLRHSVLDLSVLTLALLTTAGLLRLLLRRRLGRPLALVSDSLQTARQGLPAPVDYIAGDEVGDFVETYNLCLRRAVQRQVERDQAQEQMAIAKADQDRLLLDLPGAVYRCSISPERRLLYISPGIQQLTGVRATDLRDLEAAGLSALILEEDRERVWREIDTAVRHHEPYRVEYRLLGRDGQWRWVMEQGCEVEVENGRPVLEGFIVDFAARKSVEEHLRQSATVFESSSEAIMVTLPDGRITAVNQAFTQITGYVEAEVLGKTPAFNKSGWHDPAFYRNLWAEIGSFGRWQGEIWNRRKNGEIYPAWLTISAVKSEDGRVVNYVANFTDIANLKRSQARLEDYYYHDALTGLANQQLFAGRLELAIQRAKRAGNSLAVLLLDVDRFDEINHRAGPEVGDRLLQAIGQRLPSVLRSQDSLARIGSDEFAVVVEDMSSAYAAATVAEKLLLLFNTPFRQGGGDYSLNVSIGIGVCPDDGQHVGALLQAADAAMYQAKEVGRGTYRFHSELREREAVHGRRLHQDLPGALHRGELRLYFQPVVSLRDGRIESAEALLRWPHPDLGLLGAEEILAVAEADRRMMALGDWVLEAVTRQILAWRKQGLPELRLSMNVARSQWQGVNLAESLAQVIGDSGVAADRLALEIPETALVGNQGLARQLRGCAELGVDLVLDRFGAAAFDQALLAQIPFTTVKLHRELLAGWPLDEKARHRLEVSLAIARALNLRSVAVGIESEAQADWLRAQGCDCGQGRLFGAAMPAQQLSERIAPLPLFSGSG